MSKNLMVLLIAVSAGLFQATAERLAKEIEINEIAPNLFGWPRELTCRPRPDGATLCCPGRQQPALETDPRQTVWKGVCQRKPQ